MAQNKYRPAPHVADMLLYTKGLASCGSCSHGYAPTLCVHGCTVHRGMEGTRVDVPFVKVAVSIWREYSRELTQNLRFSGESAIFLVPSEGFEGVKFFPQLHYASSNEDPAPKASTMPKPRPKREVPKPGKPVADS